MKHLLLLFCGAALAGCGGDFEPPANAHLTASNAATFHVSMWTIPSEPPLNEAFEVHLYLQDADRTERLEFALDDVFVDARMPAHGHGMNVVPELALEDGVLVARGMLFHMIGHWELYVDLERGPITERAQFDFELR